MNQKALSKSKKLEMLDIGESLEAFFTCLDFFCQLHDKFSAYLCKGNN